MFRAASRIVGHIYWTDMGVPSVREVAVFGIPDPPCGELVAACARPPTDLKWWWIQRMPCAFSPARLSHKATASGRTMHGSPSIPNLPTNAFFAYGHYEGITRVLDLMDKHGIKLSSLMIGKAVETSPDLAREIVRRGHEAAAHGRTWENSYQLSRDEERRFIADRVETIERVTGQKPVGWNAYWMRNFSGHAGRIRVLDRFLEFGARCPSSFYARSKTGVWFARKDEIARFVLEQRAGTPVIDRGPASRTGLPGPTG